MTKQEKARNRNWTKMTLMGFVVRLNQGTFTQQEQNSFENIRPEIKSLLENWDKNSERLGMKVGPRSCKVCWKYRKLTNGICKKCEQADEQI